MTYQSHPVESYETAEGCMVVSQKQTTQAGIEIEHVALIGPRKLERTDETHETTNDLA